MGVSEIGLLGWFSPNPRGILPLDGLRVTRSMRQSAKRFEVRVDTCFTQVIRGCADPSREGGWITDDFIDSYTRLHELGWAHSIEVFDRSGRLAGGLYGLSIEGFFSGESMFHARARCVESCTDGGLVDLHAGATADDIDWTWQWCHAEAREHRLVRSPSQSPSRGAPAYYLLARLSRTLPPRKRHA